MDIMIIIGLLKDLIPLLKDIKSLSELFKKEPSIEENLHICFKKALDKWKVIDSRKQHARDNESKFLKELHEKVTSGKTGRDSQDNELLKLWANEIMAEPKCSSYILVEKLDACQQNIEKIQDTVCEISKDTKSQDKKLAEVITHLDNNWCFSLETFWSTWSISPDGIRLKFDIVLAGRDTECDFVVDACKKPSVICLESTSRDDAIAFVVAAIFKLRTDDVERSRVITSKDKIPALIQNQEPLILITKVLDNLSYLVEKGYSIIYCVSKEDKCLFGAKKTLPIVERNGFLKSLESSGIDEEKSRELARDSHRESTSLRRLLGIEHVEPSWLSKDLEYIIPAILAESWNDNNENDQEVLAELSGMSYFDFEKGLNKIYHSNESPIDKIGTIWKIKFPRFLISLIYDNMTSGVLQNYIEAFKFIIQDDDPDAQSKKESCSFHFWENKHLFSEMLKEGIFQTIALLSIVSEEKERSCQWIDDMIKKEFDSFCVKRYLSNRNYLLWMAEASPSALIDFIHNDIKNGSPVMNEIFKVKSQPIPKIYYAELLWSLECLSWDRDYLFDTTDFLLRFCRYPISNVGNKPLESLYNIYRLIYPQTLVSFKDRLEILSKMVRKYPIHTCELLFKILDGVVDQTIIFYNHKFRWRKSSIINSSEISFADFTINNVENILSLLIDNVVMNEENICELIKLSSDSCMCHFRESILEKVNSQISNIKENEKIYEYLFDLIIQHKRNESSQRAMSKENILKYEQLLDKIAPSDCVIRYKHYFKSPYIPELKYSTYEYYNIYEESAEFRSQRLTDIYNQKGNDGIWEMANIAEDKYSVVTGLFILKTDNFTLKVYTCYSQQKIDESFVYSYFRLLYNKISFDKYKEYVNKLYQIDPSLITIVLYAPSYDQSLYHLVEQMPKEVQQEYWSKVSINGCDRDNLMDIVNHLTENGRYCDILYVISREKILDEISTELKLHILFLLFDKGQFDVLVKNIYCVSIILKSIPISTLENNKNKLLLIEFFLYNRLKHYMQPEEIHLVDLVTKEAESMFEIVTLTEFKKATSLADEQIKNLFVLQYDFFSDYHGCPGIQSDGTIDIKVLDDYINKFGELTEQAHLDYIFSSVVGRILGNVLENDNCPLDGFCNLVERLSDDSIDKKIELTLLNKRSFTARSFFEGGTIERGNIELFKKYKERVMLKSQRLKKVFNNIIKDYEVMARKEDMRAKLEDYRY